MTDLTVSPISIVNQIKANLQDRYDSGFPILKELLQNADDAPEAQRFILDALPGWPDAANPLLRGPGLLVVNDGLFRVEDEEGVKSFGQSAKAGDSTAAGKFGFGQKAVFHLCDAFVAHARRLDGSSFGEVLNPFLKVKIDGNICQEWEGLASDDLERLNQSVPADFPAQRFILWLPFRREGILPAPDVGFSTTRPTAPETLGQLINIDELRIVLAALRNLTSIEIREGGKVRCELRTEDASERMLGPTANGDGRSQFGGVIRDDRGHAARFVGREATVRGVRLSELKSDPHWPRTISVLSATPQPEKGEPHGAAILTETSASDRDRRGELRVSWAVFLPVSDASDLVIPLGEGDGQFRLLLHGYFFLDSGRRQIEGLDGQATSGAPADAAGLRRAWNAELRDAAVLPRLPGLLRDALDANMVTSASLARLVTAIAADRRFADRQVAIGSEHSLAQVVEKGATVWRLIAPGTGLRPLPPSATPQRIEQLFDGLANWATANNVRLAVDKAAVLSAHPPRWLVDDLDGVFAGLSPRAFQSRELAFLLGELLELAAVGAGERGAVGLHLARALRRAMAEKANFAPAESVRLILRHAPDGLLLPLPASVEHRQILRALAEAPSSILPVRGEWIDDGARSPRLSTADLGALLKALEPSIQGDQGGKTTDAASDQAASAALTLLGRAEERLEMLVRAPDLASIKVLRARPAGDREPVALSLASLEAESRAKLLFSTSPDLNKLALALASALPNTRVLIVEGETAKLLRGSGDTQIQLRPAINETLKGAILSLVNRPQSFGPDDDRRDLLQHLRPTEDDDRGVLRQLCAGAYAAGSNSVKLFSLDGPVGGLDRVVKAVMERSQTAFLVPGPIAGVLSRDMARHIGIKALDTVELEELLERNIDIVRELELTQAECEALLATELSCSLLNRLPIHMGSDGTRDDAIDAFRVASWAVPAALEPHVRTIHTWPGRKPRERQEQIIEASARPTSTMSAKIY